MNNNKKNCSRVYIIDSCEKNKPKRTHRPLSFLEKICIKIVICMRNRKNQ